MKQTRVKITQAGRRCLRCGHIWVPRQAGRPHICPKCKSALWDVPISKEEKKAKKA